MANGRRSASPASLTGSFAVAVAMIGTVLPAYAADDDPMMVVPYRPTVSTPARLSNPGWIEGEFGGQQIFDRSGADGASQRSSIPYTIKLAFDRDWGVRVGGEGLVRTRADDGARQVGVGDTGVVVKRRFGLGANPDTGLGIEAGLLVPTARRALQMGSGKPDWSVNGIFSLQVDALHIDANVVETRAGGFDDGTSRWQSLGAFAASYPLVGKWGATGEVSGVHRRGVPQTAQFLSGLTYQQSDTCVFDFGAIRGLDRAAPRWQAFAGMTVLLARLP